MDNNKNKNNKANVLFFKLADLLCRFPITTFSKKTFEKIVEKKILEKFTFFLSYQRSALGGLGPLV
jgi:hypothetical protein